MNQTQLIQATGRRKTSVAQVRIMPGAGKLLINNRSAEDFFQGHKRERESIFLPAKLVKNVDTYDVYVKVYGGGMTGQTGAIRLGLARAYAQVSPENRKMLRKDGFLTRDPRMVERKKPGQPKARKRFQYSKR